MLSLKRSALLALATLSFSQLAFSQSQTTGTLNLRNGQPETVSLSIPTAGVAGYRLLLPATIGAQGQSLVISNVTGTTASFDWINASFWQLEGTAITTGGTAANQQYLGTSNSQDLVLASNGSEAIRIVGTAGPNQGFIGIGTSLPTAPVDIAETVLLSNSGTASELRFAEPSASGTNYTAFKATDQTANIVYTLPTAPPSVDNMTLASTTAGVLSWASKTDEIARGVFIPAVGQHVHVIPIGAFPMNATTVPIVTMMNPQGTTIGISVTNVNPGNGTITVETSVDLGTADRVCWMLINQ